jgi:hypothetical protein
MIKMKHEEVDDLLIKLFPEFIIDDIDEGFPYCVAGSFAFYLLEAFKSDSVNTLASAGAFIENLYSYKDDKIDNLATVGYLEAIQNVWGNNEVDPDEMCKYLGEESKKWWIELSKFWNGQIQYLGETYTNE